MTDKLPPHLLQLFQPRPPLRWVQPADHAPEKRQTTKISGIAQFLEQKQEYDQIPYTTGENWFSKKIKDKHEKRERAQALAEDPRKECTAECLSES